MGKLLYWGSGLGLFVLMLRLGLWLLFWPLGLVEHLVGNSRRRQRRNLREQRRQTAALERVARSVA
jgi:hypothetical protein